MDSRTAAHVLAQIAELLELHGKDRFRARAYESAAKAVLGLGADDLAPLLASGELARTRGLGPATLSVIEDLVNEGRSRYLDRLRENVPEGLVEMLRIPGLRSAKIRLLHESLGISSVAELEQAATDGRLAAVKGFGPKTAERLRKGIEFLRASDAFELYPRARAEAERFVAAVGAHPEVERAEIAGSVRRRLEIVRDIDVVAACRADPAAVVRHFAGAPGVREVTARSERSATIRFVDGARLDLHAVTPAEFPVAFWRATGSAEHVGETTAHARALGFALDGDILRDAKGEAVALEDEAALYRALGLAWIPPELREGRGELETARAGSIPRLVERGDLRGVLHCHSTYSDGKATIAEMAEAAIARGWSYIGITDHSVSAFYAGGLSRDDLRRQHEEIDELNARFGARFRVLKGIEADILPDGRVDYDEATLDSFEYVVGSVHSRFAMDERTMTDRVLKALDDPHLTILGHPTGRLLLAREPYPIDMPAVIARAGEVGACIELNADPHRLDLDWRLCRLAAEHEVPIEIGPDAHSTQGLDNVDFGIGIARKGWLTADQVLNARSADDVLAFARRRRDMAGSAR